MLSSRISAWLSERICVKHSRENRYVDDKPKSSAEFYDLTLSVSLQLGYPSTHLRHLADSQITCVKVFFDSNQNPKALDRTRRTNRLQQDLSTCGIGTNTDYLPHLHIS